MTEQKPRSEDSSDSGDIISFAQGRERLEAKRKREEEEKAKIRRAQTPGWGQVSEAPSRGWARWVQIVGLIVALLFGFRACGVF